MLKSKDGKIRGVKLNSVNPKNDKVQFWRPLQGIVRLEIIDSTAKQDENGIIQNNNDINATKTGREVARYRFIQKIQNCSEQIREKGGQ